MSTAKVRYRRRRRTQRAELLQDIDEQLRLDRPVPLKMVIGIDPAAYPDQTITKITGTNAAGEQVTEALLYGTQSLTQWQSVNSIEVLVPGGGGGGVDAHTPLGIVDGAAINVQC